MPPIIRLKHHDRHHPTESRKVVELAYGKFNVPFTRIITTNEGFKVICRNEQDADKILSKEAKNELGKIGLIVITPPETRAKRTIILRQLDQLIGTNSAEDIKQELETENDWIKVEEVIKIKNYTHILKLRLEDTAMVDKAQQQGILAYNLAISPSQIEQERYFHVNTCYKCYQIEDHQTKDCPYKELKICSECSETGHTFRECRNNEKMCINCKRMGNQANHRTLAMSCPLRKKVISEKITENKSNIINTEENTYAAIAKRAVAEVRYKETPTQLNLSEYKHTKILISIMHAHVMNLCNPGSYQKELNKMLEKNELPTMWFPENPESGKLLGATSLVHNLTDKTTTETQENETAGTTEMETENEKTIEQHNRDPRLERRSRQETGTIPRSKERSKSRNRQDSTPEQIETGRREYYPETAQEIGLKIHVAGKTMVPTMDPHIEYVIEQIQLGNYKWTYIDNKYDEELVKKLIQLKMIKITKNDFKRTDEGTYRKIRNGLNIRSPLQEIRKTKKHT